MAMQCAYHPDREPVGACVECGRLICDECKTALKGKFYCPACADKVFVRKSEEAEPVAAAKTEVMVPMEKQTVALTPLSQEMATSLSPKVPTAPTVSGKEKINPAWWLLPIFFTWLGGLIAWFVNKNKNAKTARNMLLGGLGMIVVQVVLVIVLLVSVAVPTITPWQSERPIKEALTVTAGTQDVSLGDLTVNLAKVAIPAGTFPPGTLITVVTPENAPPVSRSDATPIGAPISITAGDKGGRINQLITTTMQFDKSKLPSGTQACLLWATFYDGQQWQYFRPDAVDLQAGTITFTTGHLCLFGATKLAVDKFYEKYVNSKVAVGLLQKKGVVKTVDDIAEQAIDNLLKERLGIEDESIKGKVLSSLLKDDEYKELYDKYEEGDAAGFCQTLDTFIGQKIAENVEKTTLSAALKWVSKEEEGPEWVDAATQATADVAAGNYRAAGEIIGGKIANKFFLVKAATTAMAVTQFAIDAWKNAEIEAAYQAYKTGANGGFGFDETCKGSIDQTFNQCDSVLRQLAIDAIKNENMLREKGGQPDATPDEGNIIRAKVMSDLKQMFIDRAANEQQMEAEQAKLKALINAYQTGPDSLLGDSYLYRFASASDELEPKLDELLHLRDKILRDTSGKQLTNDDIITLSKAYLTGSMEEGKAKYIEDLKSKFGINLGGAPASVVPVLVPAPTAQQPATPPVQAKPSLSLSIPSGASGPGVPYTFTVSPTNIPTGVVYTWYVNGTNVDAGIDDLTVNALANFFQAGTQYAISVVATWKSSTGASLSARADGVFVCAAQAPSPTPTPTPLPTPAPAPYRPAPATTPSSTPTGSAWVLTNTVVSPNISAQYSTADIKMNISGTSATMVYHGHGNAPGAPTTTSIAWNFSWTNPPASIPAGQTFSFTAKVADAGSWSQSTGFTPVTGIITVSGPGLPDNSETAGGMITPVNIKDPKNWTPSASGSWTGTMPSDEAPGQVTAIVVNIQMGGGLGTNADELQGTITYNYQLK
ncbi:MAG: hypothetical protein ABSG90_11420 [Dehalococcoidia bacterium]|jgi:hypothetical protein